MSVRTTQLISGQKLNCGLLFVVGLFWCLPARATAITAASCSQTDVQTAINSAVTGDTVNVPGPCSATWSSFVAIASSQGITINGGGNTTLSNTSQGFSLNAGSVTTRITGFICNRASNIPTDYNGHCLKVSGGTNAAPYRIDHWTFCAGGGTCGSQAIFIDLSGNGPGLFDHNSFTAGSASEMIHNLGTGSSGWTDDITPGGPNMVFIEDNTVTVAGNPPSAVGSFIQGYYGSRTVLRHNNFSQMVLIDMHGTCGNVYARWWEVYENTWTPSITVNQYAYIGMRGGSGVIFNNHVINPQNNTGGGAIKFIEDCTSGTYPIPDQIGRGVNQNYNPAYAWGNDSSMAYGNQGSFIHSNDVFTSSSQPSTMIRCEAAADGGTPGTDTCPTTYSYVPYTYPHPLQGQGPQAPSALAAVVH